MNIDWRRLWPIYWMQNEPTDYAWDKLLNDLLDKHTPVRSYMTCKLGKIEVWVGNFPYSYGGYYDDSTSRYGLPTVKTRLRLRAALNSADVAKIERLAS